MNRELSKAISNLYSKLIENLYSCTVKFKGAVYVFEQPFHFVEEEQINFKIKQASLAKSIVQKYAVELTADLFRDIECETKCYKDESEDECMHSKYRDRFDTIDIIEEILNQHDKTQTVTFLMPVTLSHLPACYGYNHMTPEQQQEYLKSLNVPEDRKVFVYPCTFQGCHNKYMEEWKDL